MLRRLLYAWIFNVAAIWVASAFIDGVDYSEDYWILIVAGLVFGLVNFFLKPVLKLLALPLIIITLGIALFFINLFMLYITSWIVPGFALETFRAAVWATIVIWAVNWVLHAVFGVEERRVRRAAA
jgi:putative membrane protein